MGIQDSAMHDVVQLLHTVFNSWLMCICCGVCETSCFLFLLVTGDHSDLVSRRVGFIPLRLVCLVSVYNNVVLKTCMKYCSYTCIPVVL